MHRRQVRIDRQPRRFVRLEALELGMVFVPARLVAKDGARQQGLAPQRDEALRVEVHGMQGPEAHGGVAWANQVRGVRVLR